MSKYVRTEDGKIFEIGKFTNQNGVEINITIENGDVSENFGGKFTQFHGLEKESDNLEKLFDEYVWDEAVVSFIDKNKFTYKHDDYIFDLNETIIKEGFYGAIWVKKKGLIYVAKLNEDEEWELI